MDGIASIAKPENSKEYLLRQQYGDLLTLAELAVIFKFPSIEACRKAIARGQLPIELIRFPKRRGCFASTRIVALYLDSLGC